MQFMFRAVNCFPDLVVSFDLIFHLTTVLVKAIFWRCLVQININGIMLGFCFPGIVLAKLLALIILVSIGEEPGEITVEPGIEPPE